MFCYVIYFVLVVKQNMAIFNSSVRRDGIQQVYSTMSAIHSMLILILSLNNIRAIVM